MCRASGWGSQLVVTEKSCVAQVANSIDLYFFNFFNGSYLLTSTGKAVVRLGTAASCCPVLYRVVELEGDRV